MILLDGHSLTASRVVTAEKMSLQLKERDSTASMTPDSLDGIGVNSWLKDDRDPCAGIVWRVRSINQSFNTNTPNVSLDHAICTLKDLILFGEVTPATITGSSGATTCTARQAVEYILSQQSDWTLGSFDYGSVSNAYKFDGDTLFDALETVTDTLTDAVWTYDMSSYPFTLNIVAASSAVDSELRAGRNLRTISRVIDKSNMYTRFYPIGNDDLHISGNYVEKNVATYGVISKTETDQSRSTEAELIAWANDRLNAHAQPVVTITADGLELSQATGEPLDALTVGKVCLVPLPEFNTTIQERITELSYPDKINQPEVVKITLANSRNDVTKIIANAIKSGGRGGRGAARKDKEDHAWFEDTNDHVAMVATGIIGVDAQGNPNWTRLSEFIADGEGLHAKVETQMGEVTDRVATLEINETEIRGEVAAASSTMYSVVSQTATNFYTEVSRRARVFVQVTDPRNNAGVSLVTGDIWIKSVKVQSWNDFAGKTWSDAGSFDWNQYAGAPQYTWDGTRWEKIGDYGATVEWGTRIDQNETNITLLAHAIGIIDPTALASIDISADQITLAVSSAKSELYSVIRQTSTNITAEVGNEIDGISSYVEQTASTLNSAIARKNKVFVMMTDPASGNTVIDGDIWIKSSGNDNIHPTWSDLSAKSWTSQNSTNWREYYEGYWYVRKNGAWERMNANADVVEIGTKVEQDENQISLIARTVDENHQELGARLQVTATQIRSEVHAAKSTLYSEITQTATQIRSEVTNTTAGLTSSITQNADKIALVVETRGGTDYIKPASIVAAINNGASTIKLSADHIDIDGLVTALGAKDIGCGQLTVEGYSEFYKTVEIGQGISFQANAGITISDGKIKMGNYNASWKSKTVVTGISRSNTRYFMYARNGHVDDPDTILGSLVTDTATATIYYLGR